MNDEDKRQTNAFSLPVALLQTSPTTHPQPVAETSAMPRPQEVARVLRALLEARNGVSRRFAGLPNVGGSVACRPFFLNGQERARQCANRSLHETSRARHFCRMIMIVRFLC